MIDFVKKNKDVSAGGVERIMSLLNSVILEMRKCL